MENISCSDSRTDHNAVLYFVFFVVSTLCFFYVDRWTGTSTRNVVRHDHHTYFLFYFVSCLSSLSLSSSYSSSFERCLPGETITASPHVSCVLFFFLFSGWGPGDESKQSERMDEIGKWDAMSSHIRPKSTVPLENTAVLPSRFLLTHGERRHQYIIIDLAKNM